MLSEDRGVLKGGQVNNANDGGDSSAIRHVVVSILWPMPLVRRRLLVASNNCRPLEADFHVPGTSAVL
jgi:hypothetical protein